MPILEHLRINELDPDSEIWFLSVLETIETLDVDAYVAMMSDDVELVMDGGATRFRGREEVRAGLREAWSGLVSLVHDELNIYGSGDRFAHETIIHSVTEDGQQLNTSSSVWVDRDEVGLLSAARVY